MPIQGHPSIENTTFVLRLQKPDEVAWEILRRDYGPVLRNKINEILAESDYTFPDRDTHNELLDSVMQQMWGIAYDNIANLHFGQAGDVYIWLQKLLRRITIADAFNIEHPMFVELLQKQDRLAWNMLIRSTQNYLERVAHSQISYLKLSKQDAQDIVHDGIMLAYDRASNIRAGHVLGFMCSFVRNQARNHRRKERKRMHLGLEDGENSWHLNVRNVDTPETNLIHNQKMRRFYRALNRVFNDARDEKERRILIRRLGYNEKPADIAAAEDVPVHKVYEMTKRAKLNLKRYLLDDGKSDIKSQ